MPEHLCWPVWRLYVAKGTDPAVIERTWTLKMVLDANEALDLQQEVDELAMEKARKKQNVD